METDNTDKKEMTEMTADEWDKIDRPYFVYVPGVKRKTINADVAVLYESNSKLVNEMRLLKKHVESMRSTYEETLKIHAAALKYSQERSTLERK